MKNTYVAVALGLSVLLSACSTQNSEAVCSAELTPTVTPDSLALEPGETAQPIFKVFTCGGKKELDVAPTWVSADPKIATVDASSGLITAQHLGGNTDVTVSEQEYGTSAVVRVSVPIIDPTP